MADSTSAHYSEDIIKSSNVQHYRQAS